MNLHLENMHIENIVGRLLDQLVCCRANSSGNGPARLENTNKIFYDQHSGLALLPTRPVQAEKKRIIIWKRVKDKIQETVKKILILPLLLNENIVGQALNQLACNIANSTGKGGPTQNVKKRIWNNSIGLLFTELVWNWPSSSGKARAHLENRKK